MENEEPMVDNWKHYEKWSDYYLQVRVFSNYRLPVRGWLRLLKVWKVLPNAKDQELSHHSKQLWSKPHAKHSAEMPFAEPVKQLQCDSDLKRRRKEEAHRL